MQKINTADGLFVDGNPSTGALGTVLTAAWLNMLQAELISVLTAAGIAVDSSKSDQLTSAIQTLLRGKATVNVAGGVSVNLTAAQYGMPILILTGALTANINLIFPAISGAWIVRNQTTGAFSVTCKTAAGTGVVVSQGYSNALWGDGTNIYAEQSDWANVVLTAAQSSAAIIANAAGTADAITASYTPAVTALSNGLTLYVRAGSANTTTTPTFTPNNGTVAAKTIVKGAGAALAAGDISGGGHWLELQYDQTLDKWVLLNPASGVATAFRNLVTVTATGNWSVPAGVYLLDVELWGGGGGGGGSGSGGGTAGGGGAGGYARKFVTVTPGQTISCTIGAAGSAGGMGGVGGNGGTTSFGAFMSATGGVGGGVNPSGNGGSGGTGTGGTINLNGGVGSTGAASNVQGGGGGTASGGGGGGGGGAQGTAGAGAIPGGGGGGGGSSSTGGGGALGQINIRY